MMKWREGFLLLMVIFCMQHSFAQCKTFSLTKNKDTVNCTDFNDQKQGQWIIRVTDNHGEPGYQEEGAYKNGKREGSWTRYSLIGDVLATENYRWGVKDGICRYYNLMGLLREESWKAIDPLHPYDTVKSYHLDNPDKYDLRIMKVESSNVKQGTWTYYDPERGTITKTEEYVLDQLVVPHQKTNLVLNDSTNKKTGDSLTTANKNKPPEVLQWEKKNQKKKIKVRDGATGVN